MKKLIACLALTAALMGAPLAHASSGDSMNFRFGAIGLLVGAINLHLDFALDENWTLGPSLMAWNWKTSTSDPQLTGDASLELRTIGARGNWFKNGAFTDGLYVGPSLDYASVQVEVTDVVDGKLTGKASGLVASGLVGYGWFWESFNMMLGGGLSLGLGFNKVEVTDSNGDKQSYTGTGSLGAGLAAEYTLGWTF